MYFLCRCIIMTSRFCVSWHLTSVMGGVLSNWWRNLLLLHVVLCRCWVSIAVTAGLQVMLTYVPGLNWFFGMPEGMMGIQWARVLVSMVIVYIVVEIEKALVDPLLMPMVRPLLEFIEEHSPKFLRIPSIDSLPGASLLKKPFVKTSRALQKISLLKSAPETPATAK